MKYIQQLDMSDCGAACLAMIASHYGITLSIADIRNAAGTDVIGTNVKGLVEAAGRYGLKAAPVKGSADALVPSLAVPFISHLHIEKEEGKSYIKIAFDMMNLLGFKKDLEYGMENVKKTFGFDFS